ncbi:MAG: hypothetical protein V1736_08715, partial [Pseudomonadota bacterium]
MNSRFLPIVFLAVISSLVWVVNTSASVTFATDTLIDSGDTAYDGQDLIIDGCTVSINGTHTFMSIATRTGGILTHTAGQTGFNLTITGDLTVDEGGVISMDGKGFGGGQGPGAGSGCRPGT